MKKNLKNSMMRYAFVSVILIVISVMLPACSRESAHEHEEYTCPMHPSVLSDRPGACPVCGMDLVRKTTVAEDQKIDKNLSDVLQSTNESVIADAKTIHGEFKAVPVSYEAQGVVTYDTRNIFTISTRVAGRIEKLYVKFPFQTIAKGQKVADIYSPELITAQREFLFLLENDPENTRMIESSRSRLLLLGLTGGQVNSLAARKTVENTFTLYSPYTGYAIPDGASSPVSGGASVTAGESNGMDDGMESAPTQKPAGEVSSPQADTPALMREGNYVGAGQTLFRIVNNSSLRIELDLPADLASTVKKGDQLKMDFGAGHEHTAVVDFIQPYFDKDREFVKVRLNTNNTDNLHIGHLLHARIKSDSIEGMWVPRQAVLDLGKEKVVFIRENNTFVPRPVKTGITSGGLTLIAKGITSKDEIAANAQFLIDSESIIKSEK